MIRYIASLRYIALVLLCVLLLPACRHEKRYKIGVSQCSSDDWRAKMNEEILRETMFHDNIDVEIRSADDSNEKQIDDIRYFADHGFDIIIAAPNEAAPLTPVIDEVMSRGIPVMVFDRNVSGNNFTAFQGADNDSIGYEAAAYVRSKAGPSAKIIEIFGNPGSTPAIERHKGFAEGLGDMKLLGSGIGYWNYAPALHVADSLLRLYPETEVVFAHNDRMAIAAADAADRLGLDPFIIGIDAAPEIGMKAVAEGKIDASFIYPTEGYLLIQTAIDILEGRNYERITLLPAVSAVDKSNADILILQNQALEEETGKMSQLKEQVDNYWSRHYAQTALLYATLVILALLFLLLFLFLRSFWQKQRQQKLLIEQNMELERQRDNEKRLNEELRVATQSKLVFFTNVSHDLRTPLTLIAEPVRQIAESSGLSDSQKSLLKIASKNVQILERLINQVLDFRKYENGHMPLNLTEVDACQLIDDWTEAFNSIARQRHIKLVRDLACRHSMHIALDVEKIERVFFNLLSNAFKYTPDNGTITVSARQEGDEFVIGVSDTGRGISAEDLPNIFDSFFQVDKVHPNGSGIGLSLAKAFVELHDGRIEVESRLGEGTEFRVYLPVRHVAETAVRVESSISQKDVSSELESIDLYQPGDESAAREAAQSEGGITKPVVLAIDDNADILAMLKTLLSDKYHVITATDGANGLRLAAKYVPDVVICDVMMPRMDGLECCSRLKAEISTSHIPVLMLTACSLDEQRVQGYESGADAYLPKPFNSEVLKARIKSLIDNRKRISGYVRSEGAAAQASAAAVTDTVAPQSLDNEFYNKFIEAFRSDMSNPEVNVDELASRLGLGRSQLYRKIKALTNFSPVELMRNLRLKEARRMLLKTEKTVSEIAYAVGFSTPAYFTKCYREEYGETPSETRTNLIK